MRRKNLIPVIMGLGVFIGSHPGFATEAALMNKASELQPGESMVLEGSRLGTKKMDCILRSQWQNNALRFYSERKQHVINGVVLKERQSVPFSAPINSHFFIEMERHSKLMITNIGQYFVNLSCN